MNLLLFFSEEVGRDGCVTLRGRRYEHLRQVLKLQPGDVIRAGVVDGPRGTAKVLTLTPDAICLRVDCREPVAQPAVDLILALPRPKVLKRLYSVIAMLGVQRLFLVNASKVERNYFDTHWLNPEPREAEMIRGLEQAGDTRLPRVTIERKLNPFLQEQAECLFEGCVRLIAHPVGPALDPARLRSGVRTVLAIGPEGGWTDHELELFRHAGFSAFTLGPRILRTDVAVIAAVSRIY